jgi:ATP-binding cassette subfamily F protein 3
MISAEQVKLSFGGFDLFKGISFIVNPRDRIGLVGKNGAGKTTLLKVLAGIQKPSEGVISSSKETTLGYLPQNMKINDTSTLFNETQTAFKKVLDLKQEIDQLNDLLSERNDYDSEEYHNLIQRITDLNDHYNIIGGHNYVAEIEQTLIGLGFQRSDFSRHTSEFSGGWRMRIELAKLLLLKPDIFLLDEPTNHLDIESIQWLEDFLKNYKGAVVLVSHDKAFLDNVTNRTIEISLGKIYDFKTNYSKYVELRAERKEHQLSAFRNQQKVIQDAEEFIERFRYKATKAVQVQSRIKQLEKIEIIEVDEEDNQSLNLKFPPAPRSGKVVAEARSLSKSYGDKKVLDQIDITIEQGEKIAFVGKNGEGKTTLAKIITSEIDHKGHLKIGHNVKIGYFAQNQADLLDEEQTVLETLDRVAVGDIRSKIRDILGAFMFSGETVEKKVKVLSGGERTRLAMIKLMLEPVNFLVLDEPTNHLDMKSKDILKKALLEFSGTLLVVSHDREFLDGLVNCVYEFRDKKIKQNLGGIYDFIQKKKIESLKELESINKKTIIEEIPNQATNDDDQISFAEKKEINKQITKLEKQINNIENDISSIEEEIETINIKISDPLNTDNSLYTEYEEYKARLEKMYSEWEQVHSELDNWRLKKTW